MNLPALIERIEQTVRRRSHVERGERYESDVADLLFFIESQRREIAVLTANVTSVQTRCTELLEETRSVRPLLAAIRRARELHPGGCNLRSLFEEVGEVARAIRRETTERVREELIDVAVVAMRLANDEVAGEI